MDKSKMVNLQGGMMKRKFLSVMVTCFLVTLGAAAKANAQLPGTAIHASIPFDFIVSGKTLPAGTYEIRRITDSPDSLIIRNVTINHDLATFLTDPVQARARMNHGELIFNRYGDTYFLSRIWDGGEPTGRELPTSRQERQLKREVASNSHTPETVAVAIY